MISRRGGIAAECVGEVTEKLLRLNAHACENFGCGARSFTDNSHENMLRSDIRMSHSSALHNGSVNDVLGSRCEIVGRKHRR